MKALPSLLPALAVTLLLGGALVADRQSPDPDPGMRYIDLQRCMDEFPPAQKELLALNDEFDAAKAEFEKRRISINEAADALQLMEAGTDALAVASYKVEGDDYRLENDMKFFQERMRAKRSDLLVRTWLVVQRAAATVGAREGFGSVMVVPKELDPLMLQQPNAALEALLGRNLLWANPTYDITDLVVAEMNRQ